MFSEELEHESDGLIYTCVETPYTPGTDVNTYERFYLPATHVLMSTNRLKWKEDNSLDFRLVIRFPALPSDPDQPDYCAKPIFLLHVWLGGNEYEEYDKLAVDDDEWLK